MRLQNRAAEPAAFGRPDQIVEAAFEAAVSGRMESGPGAHAASAKIETNAADVPIRLTTHAMIAFSPQCWRAGQHQARKIQPSISNCRLFDIDASIERDQQAPH
jgi:hypothetical protein